MAVHDSYSGSNRMDFKIGFQTDQQSLANLKAQLQSLTKLTKEDLLKLNPKIDTTNLQQDVLEIQKYATQVEGAFQRSFNKGLGSLNLSKLQTELQNLKLNDIYTSFSKAGSVGTAAFNSIASSVTRSNIQLKQSSGLLDKMRTTLANTVRYGISSSIFNRLTDSLSGAWNYAKSLDTSLNNIRIVTGKSADEMERFARTANSAAQRLGANTKDYTNAALIYYQQGLDDAESQARAETTVKAANVTAQSGQAVSEQLTAVWNGYNVTAEQTELYVDKLAKVAATSAADLEELSVGMSKVASAANNMGVDVDRLNAMLATVISTTREAPETIGTSFRTIFARMGDLVNGEEDEGVGLGKVSGQLHNLGIEILDETGNMRDMGVVVEEIGEKWQNWTRAQQQAVAVAIAGKMQYSRLIALFDNWKDYQGYLNDSRTAMGELNKENDIYLDSTEAHLKQLDAAWEGLVDSFINNDSMNELIDIFTTLTNGVDQFIQAIGGGGNALLGFLAIFQKFEKTQLTNGLANLLSGRGADKYNEQLIQYKKQTLEAMNQAAVDNTGKADPSIEQRLKYVQKMTAKGKTTEQVQNEFKEIDELGNRQSELEQIRQNQAQGFDTIQNILNQKNQNKNKIQMQKELSVQDLVKDEQAWNQFSNDLKQTQQQISKIAELNTDVINTLIEEENTLDTAFEEAIKKAEIADKKVQNIKKKQQQSTKTKTQINDEVALKKAEQRVADIEKQIENLKNSEEKISLDKANKDLESYNKRWEKYDEDKKNRNQSTLDAKIKAKEEAQTAYDKIVESQDKKIKTLERQLEQAKIDVKGKQEKLDLELNNQAKKATEEQTAAVREQIQAYQELENIKKNQVKNEQAIEKKLKNFSKKMYTSVNNDNVNVEGAFKTEVEEAAKQLAVLSTKNIKIWNENDLLQFDAAAEKMKQLGLLTEEQSQKMQQFRSEVMKGSEALAQLKVEEQETTLDHMFKEDNLQNLSSAFVDLSGSVTSVIFGLQSLANIGNIFTDENLSSSEKFLQIMMSLSMGLPMLITGIKTAKEATDLLTISIFKENIVEEVKASLKAKNIALTKANIAAELREIIVEKAKTGEIWKQIAAYMAKHAAMFKIIAVAALVAAATYALIKAYNAESDAAKKANESAQQAAEIYANTKSKYDSLKSSIEDYKNSQKAIQELTKGTQEWHDAIREANDKVLEMLENFPELAKYVSNVNGQLVISDEGLDIAQEKQEQQVNAALRNQLIQQNISRQAKNENDETKLRREIQGPFSTLQELVNPNYRRAAEWIFDATRKDLEKNPLRYERDETGNFVDNGFGNFVKNIPLVGEKWADAIAENGKEIAKLNASISANIETNKAVAEQLAHNYAAELKNDTYNNSKYQSEIDKIIANQSDVNGNAYKEVKGQYDSGLFGISWLGVNNKSDKEVHDAYAEMMGWDVADYKNKAGKGYFKLADGTEYTLDDSAMRAALAQSEALEKSGEHIEQYARSIEKISNKIQQITGKKGETLSSFIGGEQGNFGNLTSGELKKLEQADLNDITDLYEDYGFKSAKKFRIALENGWKDYHKDEKELQYNLLEPVRNAFNNIDKSNLTLNAQKILSKTMNELYKTSGSEGMNALTAVFEEAGLSANEFASVLDNINWNGDVAAQLTDAIIEQGIEVNTTSESWKKLQEILKQISNGNGVINAFDQYRQKLSDAQDIMEKISKSGKTISDEDYQTVIEQGGAAASTYFRKTLDGYKYIGKTKDKDSLMNMLTGGAEGLKESKAQLQELANFAFKIQEKTEQQINPETTGQKAARFLREDDGKDANLLANRVSNFQQYGEKGGLKDSTYDLLGFDKESINEAVRFIQENQETIRNIDNTPVSKLTDDQKNLKGSYEESVETLTRFKQGLIDIQTQYMNGSLSIEQYDSMIAHSATSIEDLNEKMKELNLSQKAYAEAYIALDQDNDLEGVDGEELEDYAKHLQRVAKQSSKLSDELEKNDEAAETVAKGIIKMNNAIDTLADNWEDWGSILKKSSKESQEYQEALDNTRAAVADLLDTSDEYVSDDFIAKHLDEIGKAAKGNEDAIDSLKAALAQDIIGNIIIKNELQDKAPEIMNSFNDLQNSMGDIEVGATINDGDFLAKAQKLIEDCNMTVDQANAVFDALGFEANFATEEKEVEQRVPKTVTKTEVTGYTTGTAKAAQPDGTTRDVPWEYPILSQTTYNDGFALEKGVIDVPAMSTNGKTPIIKSLTKKAGGSMNNYSSSNKGGGAPGKNKSGGGGGSKEQKPDHKDRKESKKDAYHDINIQLDKIDRSLKKVQKQEEYTYGTRLLQNYAKQIEVINQKMAAQTEKYKIATGEASRLRGELSQFGVAFNPDGTVANYAAVYDQQLAQLNSVIDQYNGMSKEQQDDFKDTLEAAEKNFDNFEKKLEEYEKTVNEIMADTLEEIQDLAYQKLDLQIKEVEYKIQVRFDFEDLTKKWGDTLEQVYHLDKQSAEARAAHYYGETYNMVRPNPSGYWELDNIGMVATRVDLLNAYQQRADLADFLDNKKSYEEMQNNSYFVQYFNPETKTLDNVNAIGKAQERIQELTEKLMDQWVEWEEQVQKVRDAYNDFISESADRWSRQLDLLKSVQDVIEHDMTMSQMVFGEERYDIMQGHYNEMEKQTDQEIAYLQQATRYWAARMKNIQDLRANDPEGAYLWDEAMQEAQDNWLEAINNWNESVENAVENAQDKYLNAINLIFQNLEKKFTNNMGLDWVSQQWELINKEADRYLDNINSVYQIQKLNNKYLDAIDTTTSLSAQKKLKEIQESEMKALREKDKLSQYDIDRANLKYELTLKQIALEEAQQNKSTLRLRRDSQGNYVYQYAADQDEIKKTQDELADLYNELYNLDKDKYKENLNEMLDIYKEFQDAVKELTLDATLDDKTRADKLAELQERYTRILSDIAKDNEEIRKNLSESTFAESVNLVGQDLENYSLLTKQQQDQMLEFIKAYIESNKDEFKEITNLYGEVINLEELTDEQKKDLVDRFSNSGKKGVFSEAYGIAFDIAVQSNMDIVDIFKSLTTTDAAQKSVIPYIQSGIQDLVNVFNEPIEVTGIDGVTTNIQKGTQLIKQAIDSAQAQFGWLNEKLTYLGNNSTQNLTDALNYNQVTLGGKLADAFAASSSSVIGGIGTFITPLGQLVSQEEQKVASINTSMSEMLEKVRLMNHFFNGDDSSGGSLATTLNNAVNWSNAGHSGTSEFERRRIASENQRSAIMARHARGEIDQAQMWDELSRVQFATGGYTGEWGTDTNNGRIAILHQKELVLNEEDTKNFLTGIKLLRAFTKQLNDGMLDNIYAKLPAAAALNDMTSTVNDNSSQVFNVEAVFPNVESAKEIENALINLPNIAAQRVNRKENY